MIIHSCQINLFHNSDNVSLESEESLQLSVETQEEMALTAELGAAEIKASNLSSKGATRCCFSVHCKSKLTLLLCRSSFFIAGIAIVIAAGISSQYHPSVAVTHGNYSECTELKMSGNASSELWPGTYYSSAQITPTPDPSPTPTTSSVLTMTSTAASLHSSTPITPSHTLTSMQFERTTVSSKALSDYIQPTPSSSMQGSTDFTL